MSRTEFSSDLECWKVALRVGAVLDAREFDVVHAQSRSRECSPGLCEQLWIRREIEVRLTGECHVDGTQAHEVVPGAGGDVGHLRRGAPEQREICERELSGRVG